MTAPGPDWVEQARRLAAGLAAAAADGRGLGDLLGGPPADPAAECRWCPLCAGLAALRGRRPDLVEALADVLSTAAAALRAHGTDHPTTAPGPRPGPTAPPEETVPHPAPAPTVQRIDVA